MKRFTGDATEDADGDLVLMADVVAIMNPVIHAADDVVLYGATVSRLQALEAALKNMRKELNR